MTEHAYRAPSDIRTVAVIGVGTVGAACAALLLAHGVEVIAYDPRPGVEQDTRAFVCGAWSSLRRLGVTSVEEPPQERLRFVGSVAEAVAEADVVQENVAERIATKASVLAEIDAIAPAETIILSSTGGIPPSDLQTYLRYPERFLVLHPFNPSHLIPLVEIVPGKRTSPKAVDWTMQFARRLGKHPILLHGEINGHMTNRLQFALVREAVHCLMNGIASAEDIDAAVRYGLGPRWTLMGSLLTLHLAGGSTGMAGILDHAGEAIEAWWTPTGSKLALTPQVRDKLIDAARGVSQGRTITGWVRWRDDCLVDVLKLQKGGRASRPRVPRATKGNLVG